MHISNYKHKIIANYSKSFVHRAKYFKKEFDSLKNNLRTNYGTYLDVGCGTCYNTIEFGKKFKKIYGIEYNKNEIKMINKNLKKKFNVSFGDVQKLKFRDDFFDQITAISVLEHIHNLDSGLIELNRVLKKKGLLIIQIPNRYFLVELHTYLPFLYLIPTTIRDRLLSFLGYSKDASFANKLSKKTLLNELKNNNFYIIKLKKLIYPLELIPNKYGIFYKVLKFFKTFDIIPFGYLIICKKNENK